MSGDFDGASEQFEQRKDAQFSIEFSTASNSGHKNEAVEEGGGHDIVMMTP
jgi:hypothetical protein